MSQLSTSDDRPPCLTCASGINDGKHCYACHGVGRIETRCNSVPVCPYCGYIHSEMYGSGDYFCCNCEKVFHLEVETQINYTSTKKAS
mgnify:CR=1 FL=1